MYYTPRADQVGGNREAKVWSSENESFLNHVLREQIFDRTGGRAAVRVRT